jgi:hypothetical protein
MSKRKSGQPEKVRGAVTPKTVVVAATKTEASLLFPGAGRIPPGRAFTTVAKALANWRGCGIRLGWWSGV